MKFNRIDGKYKSETGSVIYFAVDLDLAKQYGLDKTLSLFVSASKDFAKCEDHRFNADKARVLKMPKEESKHKALIVKENAKGLEKMKKIRPLMKEVISNFKVIEDKIVESESEFIKNMAKRENELRDVLLNSNLSPLESKIMLNEYKKCKRIVKTRGREGFINHLNERFEELVTICSDPEKGWKHASVATAALIILIILLICIFGTLAYMIWYIVNLVTKEIHDTKRYSKGCKIDKMVKANKVLCKDWGEAKVYMDKIKFNGCAWCMPQYHVD